MKKIKLNFQNKVLNEGQDHLSPFQKKEILRTGKLVLPIWE